MTSREHEAANWALAFLTALVWGATYALYLLGDGEARRGWRLFIWRLRYRMRHHGPAPRHLPRPLPVVTIVPPPPAPRAARGNAAAATAVAEPVRIAEWRAGQLPLRYRLLGQARRGANDN